jgi:hypothetical protein
MVDWESFARKKESLRKEFGVASLVTEITTAAIGTAALIADPQLFS